MKSMLPILIPRLILFIVFIVSSSLNNEAIFASPFTPLEWQQPVSHHANRAFVGQHKHTTWNRDRDQNFIDDEIDARFGPNDRVNIIVDLNRCLKPAEIS